MKYRKISALLIFVMVLSLISGCSYSGRGSSMAKKGEAAAAGSKVKLCVAYDYLCENMVEAAIASYTAKNANTEFEKEMFEREKDNSAREERMNNLMTRTLAGNGPDIILEFASCRLAKNYKALKSGVYCDLNELIKNDRSFKYDDYYKNVIDMGVVDGKRYVLPLVFSAYGLLTTNELLQKNDIQIDETNWNWDQLVKLAVNFAEKNKGKEKYLLNPKFEMEIIRAAAKSQVDYENNSSHFNSQAFKKVVEDLMKVRPAIYPIEKDNGMVYTANNYLLKGKSALSFDDSVIISNPVQFNRNYTDFKEKLGQELKVIPFPLYKGFDGCQCRVNESIGISSTCKHKEEAYEFIKTFLKPDITGDSFLSIFGFSASKAGYKKMTAHVLLPLCGVGGNPRPEEGYKIIGDMINNMGRCKFEDDQIVNIVNKHYTNYIEGTETLDQAVKKMDEDVYLYLNE